MSSCEELYQERQRLLAEKRMLEEGASQLQHRLRATVESGYTSDGENVIPDQAVRDSLNDFERALEDPTLNRAVERGLEVGGRIDIGGGQPNNYVQLLQRMDVQTAADYAQLSQALLKTGQKLDPAGWRFASETYGKERIAQQIIESYAEFVDPNQVIIKMAADAAPFMGMVERMTRLRLAADGYKKSFSGALEDIYNHLGGTDLPVPGEFKVQAFNAYKLALLAERHYDMARRRTGQTLRSLQDDLGDTPAWKTDLDDGTDFVPDEAMVQETLALTPNDLGKDKVMGQVIDALDQLDAKKAAEKIKQLNLLIKLDGLDPKSRLGKGDYFNHQMKLANLLAKDSQLFNESTQLKVNLGSNFVMAIVGPYRQAFENVGTATPYGTPFSREAWKSWGSAWSGVKQAMDVVKASGREVFFDALKDGKTVFAGNRDTYGRNLTSNDEVLARLNEITDMEYMPGMFLNPANAAIYRGKLQASVRLWVHDKISGTPFSDYSGVLLQPGLRLMGATDNVAGLWHYAFKLRNDLEMKYRANGFDTSRKSVQDQIDAEFEDGFYSANPTEAQIKAFRKENGIPGSEMTDDEIGAMIAEQKLADTYGAPTMATKEAAGAELFSREMRMQNAPEEGLGKVVYEATQRARSRWEIDLAFPYFQSPLMGLLTDFTFTGITPLIDTTRMLFGASYTPAQVARVKANWIIAGHMIAGFAALEAIDPNFIIGNGPIEPGERKEWLTDLKAKGLNPNSIGGVPFLGGIPILNTLFLWKDIKENFVTGTYSDYDQHKTLLSVAQVLTGQLARQTSLGQLNQVMELITDPSKGGNLIGYMGAGQIPGIGGIRMAERMLGRRPQDYYRGADPTAAERAAGGVDGLDEIERKLKELAYGTLGLTGLISGARREKDWLGSKLQLPFGVQYKDAMSHRFFPQLWPQDKVYAELNAQNMLNPPEPLMNRTLEGVAMSDWLQKEYNDTYSEMRGEQSLTARLQLSGIKPSVSFTLPIRADLPSGATVSSDRVISVPVAQWLEKHVKGKTPIEAFRSLISDPIYRAMQDNPGTTSDPRVRDQPPAERRKKAAQVMLKSIKTYYHLLTRDKLNTSESSAAVEWRERRAALDQKAIEDFAPMLQDLVKAVNAAQ